MTRDEAARAMGVAPAEVTRVEAETEHGAVVVMSNGARRLLGDDGFYAIDDHPGNSHLRRFHLPAPEVEPDGDDVQEPGGGEGDDSEGDAPLEVPDGTVDEVMAWVADDPGRAAAALEAERSKPNPRKGLLEKLEKVQ